MLQSIHSSKAFLLVPMIFSRWLRFLFTSEVKTVGAAELDSEIHYLANLCIAVCSYSSVTRVTP